MPFHPDDPYLHERYDALHDSPMQRRFRQLCPVPFGVVFLPWKGMTEEEMRRQFRLMKELGFRNLKQTMPSPEWPSERILEIALEEGVIPFWYGEGGYAGELDELCAELGIDAELPLTEKLRHPKMWAHQKETLRERIHYDKIKLPGIEGGNLQAAGYQKFDSSKTIQLHNDPILREDAEPLFKAWCQEQYGTIEALNEAWNIYEVGIQAEAYASWEDFHADEGLSRHNKREYRYLRDVLRFKADSFNQRILARNKAAHERDPYEPQRAGGEMGLFLPYSWRGTDMEGIAETLVEYGSFYPSIHFSWHYEEVNYEVARTIYMQAALTVDWFKGGWNGTWESTGGPQQLTGAKGWTRKASEETPGFTVDAGTMSQLFFSYLAAGYKGAGLWCWNFRRAGWEAGEFALLNRYGEPSPRALRAGKIAQAADRLREEIWQLRKEPQVGVFFNWDSDAIWAAISVPGREHFKNYPVHARVGASRALINGNIPWEHVTASDLRNGLAHRYRTIYLPGQIALDRELLAVLKTYAEEGGRVVIDAPGGWYNEIGAVLDVGPGSTFEQLFGVCLDDIQYSNNVPRSIAGQALDGFIYELSPTNAQVRSFFTTGEPAITENRIGAGSAVVLAFDASYACFQAGNDAIEGIIRRAAMGDRTSPYACDGAIVFRQKASAADHYFLINDGPATRVHLEVRDQEYQRVEDAVTQEELAVGAPIELEPYGGRWLRLVK